MNKRAIASSEDIFQVFQRRNMELEESRERGLLPQTLLNPLEASSSDRERSVKVREQRAIQPHNGSINTTSRDSINKSQSTQIFYRGNSITPRCQSKINHHLRTINNLVIRHKEFEKPRNPLEILDFDVTNLLNNYFMKSISAKVLQRCKHLSLSIVGGRNIKNTLKRLLRIPKKLSSVTVNLTTGSNISQSLIKIMCTHLTYLTLDNKSQIVKIDLPPGLLY
jgi:hypothetical protein